MDYRGVVFPFFILLFSFIEFSNQFQLDLEFMTDDEIQAIFQVTRDNVPLYDVVPIMHTIDKKNMENLVVRLQVFHDEIVLYLRPVTGFAFGEHTPIYTVESDELSPHGFRYTKYSEYGLYHIYEDEDKNNAVIIIRYVEDNNYIFDGTIRENLIIRSLPQNVIDAINENSSTNESCSFPESKNFTNIYTLTNYHVVFRANSPYHRFRHSTNISLIENSIVNHSKPSIKDETKEYNGKSKTVYPEILAILDYNTFNYFRSDISEILMYMVAFWIGVDSRYRALNDPRIYLKLAMIVIALDKNATPYINEYQVDNNTIGTNALNAIGQYLYAEKRFDRNSYDIAIVISRLEICQWLGIKSDPSNCKAIRGIGRFGSSCSWSDTDKLFEGIALVHDRGFNGIASAAHELGHVLGVPHDGSTSADYVGGPGAAKCDWKDGYLMSSHRFTKNAFKWSSCSIECFKHFLQQPSVKCLHNKPKLSITLPRILPGKLLSLDEQCVESGGLDACYHDEGVCTLLRCTKIDDLDKCFGIAPAAEGSPCGIGKICIEGECIDECQ